MTEPLERALSDVRRKWVPDHRLGVLEVSVESAAQTLAGKTTSRDALAALERLARDAGLAPSVELLPAPALRERWAVVTAPLAPLLSAPLATAVRVSEALHGEPLAVLEERDDWLRVRAGDGYHAWTARGYLATGPDDWLEDWVGRAGARAAGAELRGVEARMRLPCGSRVALRRDGRVETADGELWSLVAGVVRPEGEWRAEAAFLAPPEWVLRWYARAPYQWGGRSDWGIDCSGLAQATYAARGVALPRDSDLQWSSGREIPLKGDGSGYEAGDLLFFAEAGRVSHVALWAGAGRIVHSALARGGVASDDLFGPSPLARRLRDGLVGVRRVKA